MKILFDTNVVLDVLLNRQDFSELAGLLFTAVENKKITGYLSATTITTLDYLISKSLGRKKAKLVLIDILRIFEISDVNSKVINQSLLSDFSDFEDAVQYYSGINSDVTGYVTRNKKDFKTAKLPVYSPQELLAVINNAI